MTESRHGEDVSATPMEKNSRPGVLVMCSTFPRWKNDTVPDFVERLAASMVSRFRIVVLAPHYKGARTVERWKGFVVVRYRYFLPEGWQKLAYGGGILPNIRRAPWLLAQLPCLLFAGAIACRRLTARRRFSLIHAHWIVPQLLQACIGLAGSRQRPATIVTSHGGDLWSFQSGLLSRLKRWAVRRADAATVVSTAMKPLMQSLGARGNVTVIPMGTETDRFSAPPRPAPLDNMLFVGRLSEKKGADIAMRAMARLADTRSTLTMIGDGPLRNSLERLANDLGIADRVRFAGWVQRGDLPIHFAQHGLFIFPSIITRSGDQEGLGLTLAEAMASGCTAIASDLPAVRDLAIHEDTALTFEAGNVTALAAAMQHLLDDPVLARQLASNGSKHVEREFSMHATTRKFSALYEALVNR